MGSCSRSPLRYPGSKARFAPFIAQALQLNGLRQCLFVEPFCGGANLSLAMLEMGIVGEVALNDADPDIAAFWDTVFSPHEAQWLADQAMTVPLTLEEWDRQKSLVPESTRAAALRCLYLNRTSFNGILHWRGGPIGGRTQAKRTLGVRFNRAKLAARILELSKLSHRVVAVDGDQWQGFLARHQSESKAVFYLDPPFYHKAETLYTRCFDAAEHQELRNTLQQLLAPWLLSYDDAPEVRELYGSLALRSRVIDSTYSTHPMGGSSYIGRELFYTNLRCLPAPGPAGAAHVGLTVLQSTASASGNAAKPGPLRRPASNTALSSVTEGGHSHRSIPPAESPPR